MNELMTFGGRLKMAEAGGEGGGGDPKPGEGGGGDPKPGEGGGETPKGGEEPTSGETTKPGEQKPGETTTPGEGGVDQKPGEEPTSAVAKMLKGETKPKDGEKPGEEPKGGEQKPGEEPKPFTDEDFTKAMVASEAVKKAAGDETIQLSPELVKGMLPAIRKANLSPEQANELANALAAQQIAAAKAHGERRQADIAQMNDEAMKLFPDRQSWESIGAGVRHFFKPGGAMFETIAHSELGSDPEFLAMMKWVGERVAKDGLGGAPGAGGERRVSYEKALMG